MLNDCNSANIYGEERWYGYKPISLLLTLHFHIYSAPTDCICYRAMIPSLCNIYIGTLAVIWHKIYTVLREMRINGISTWSDI